MLATAFAAIPFLKSPFIPSAGERDWCKPAAAPLQFLREVVTLDGLGEATYCSSLSRPWGFAVLQGHFL